MCDCLYDIVRYQRSHFMTRAFSSRTYTSCLPQISLVSLFISRDYHQMLPPCAVNSESIMVVLAKKIGGTTSFRSELPKYVSPRRDRECTYSIVGLPAFSDIMFPPFFTECCGCELIIAWREPGCQPCLIIETKGECEMVTDWCRVQPHLLFILL